MTSIFPLKEHIATLKTLSSTVDGLQNTISSFTPLQNHVKSLEQLATKSTFLLLVVSEREQLTQDIKQLQNDVTQHSHVIPQLQLTSKALEQRMEGSGTLPTDAHGLVERLEAAKVRLKTSPSLSCLS